MERWLIRTSHFDTLGEITIAGVRLTAKRGVGTYTDNPQIWMRVNRDNKGFGKWTKRGLGKTGDRVTTIELGGFGCANSWQFEFSAPDDADVDLVGCEVLVMPLGH